MSKNSTNNQPACSSATNIFGPKQDKHSFSIWNLFNSRNKTCEAKHCDEEGCELGKSSSNNSTSDGLNCCSRNTNSCESIKMSKSLKENLSDSNSVQKRISFIKEFNEIIGKSHVCYSDFKLIIYKTIDVFNLRASSEELNEKLENVETRLDSYNLDDLYQLKIQILKMYARLVDQQFDLVQDEVRKILFDVLCNCIPLKRSDNLDDRINQKVQNQLNEAALELIGSLTNQGKSVCYLFKLEIGELCLEWFDDFLDSPTDLTYKYLTILTDLIRFNASVFLKTYCKFVQKTSHFFSVKHETNHLDKEIHLCLELFDVIFRYGTLPSEVLDPFLRTLCIAVNYENLKKLSWKIMRNLINNVNLSYTVLENLSDYINAVDSNDREQVQVVCGSIHFITNSLWNEEFKVDTIKHQPSYILPTLSKLINENNLTISIHVATAIQQLLETQTVDLEPQHNGHSANGMAFSQQPHPTTKRKDLMIKLNDTDEQNSLLLIYWKSVWNILRQLTDQCSAYTKESNQRSNLSGGGSSATLAGQNSIPLTNKSKQDHTKLFEVMDVIVTIVERLFLGNKQFNYDERSFNFLCVYTNLQINRLDFDSEYPPMLTNRISIIIDRYEQITNSNYENWLQSLTQMVDLCFKSNLDTNLRIRTLKCLQTRLRASTEKDEELIIDKIVIPYLKDVDQEIDFKVRDQILRFLIGYLKEVTNNLLFIKVFEIISRTLKKSLVRSRNNSDTSNDVEIEEDPNVLIVRGLMMIFETKIYEKDCTSSIEVFRLLSSHGRSHYCEGHNFEKISYSMRSEILRFMFSIKPNHEGYIGIQKDDQPKSIRYSKFLRCKTANQIPKSPSISSTNQVLSSFTTSMPLAANQFSYEEMFSYINLCLSKERDWNILSIVLDHLPFILSNSHIVYSTNFEQVIRIICENCLTLSREFSNPNSSNNYINMPKNVKSADLQNYAFSVLTSLIPYRDFIKPDVQTLIVSKVGKGLLSKQSIQQCITCLTIFTTEFQDAISKDLPRILNQLSKTTASQQLAIPILEFLSILNLWPNLYSSFVSNEFLLIFAIIIPYTNPMKFDEFSVALAYRVATLWYLSSRYQYRKTITDFIIKQLPENIKFNHRQSKENIYNDEYRKRSSSLNTENNLNRKSQDSSNASSRLSGYSNNSLANAVTSGRSAHQNSPSLQSPAHQNSVVFNFNGQEKLNQGPISPNTKQLSYAGNKQQTSSHSQLQQAQIEVLHTEFIECFVDLMSRNVVCGCSTLPNQDPISKFLLENGQCETWLLGNKLITITTSSCNSKAVKGGDLCESCFNKLNAFEGKSVSSKPMNDADDVFNEPMPSSNTPSLQFTADSFNNKLKIEKTDFQTNRRRHQSAYVQTASGSVNRNLTSRDDSQIENNSHMYNLCRSWASGWAEILIRTATGNTSWITKLQNSLFSNFQSNEMNDLLINHLITSSDRPNELASTTTYQSTISLNQQPINQNLGQISEQSYPAASTTNLSQQSTSRCRSNTISNSSEMSMKRNERLTNYFLRPNENDLKFKNKMHPSFVFLQFFHQGAFGNAREAPILLPKSSILDSTLKLFDLITPSETYKVGIIYVDKKQINDRQQILRNESGSDRYMQFIKRVGTLIPLDKIDSKKVFIGGLTTDGTDGDFACIYHENLTQVVFHVATFMPNKENDPKCNDKMRHIGNNHVCIVFNDSQEEFDFSVIKGQWLKACIIVTPCAHEQNLIQVQATSELESMIMYTKPFQIMISDQNMPHFVRQLSISTSLISLVCQCKGQNFTSSPFLSNWVNRIRKIKQVRERAKNHTNMTLSMKHKSNASSNEDVSSPSLGGETNSLENFTNYI